MNKMYRDGDDCRYVDDDELVVTRDCGQCSIPTRPDGHDACLGRLPLVMNACCGHKGKYEGAYVQFTPRVCVRGRVALVTQWLLIQVRRWLPGSDKT